MCSTERNRDLARADVSAMVGTSPNEIRKTYRNFIKEATDGLNRVQEQAWIAQGLDKDGTPQDGYSAVERTAMLP